MLVIINQAATNLRVPISVGPQAFISLCYLSRRVIAGSYGNRIFICFFYETAKLFQKDRTIVPSHQQCVSEPVSLQSRQHVVALLFFRLATLIVMQGYVIVVLFFPNGVEHLFVCLFAICISFNEIIRLKKQMSQRCCRNTRSR